VSIRNVIQMTYKYNGKKKTEKNPSHPREKKT